MKKVIKIYETIVHPLLFTSIMVNGKRIRLEFTGHQRAPKFVMGRIVVHDPELQKAMDNDPRYGKHWKLKRTEYADVRPEEVNMEDRLPLQGAAAFQKDELTPIPGKTQTEEPDAPKKEKPEVVDIHGVSNLSSAKARLADAADIPIGQLPNTKADIITWANENGYNLVGYTL